MYRLRLGKKAFTLVEVVIVCTIFAIMVVWIILWINRAFLFMNNTRVLVRATNFAREGVEMVYNLRDTNRRKYSGEKDKHWMDAGTWNLTLKSWIYVIKEWITWTNNDIYVYADKLDISDSNIENFYDLEWFFTDSNQPYRDSSKIEFTWNYSYYSWGVIATWNLEDLLWWSGIEFYRILRVYGIYCKKSDEPDQLVSPNYCKEDTDPKELRFCVKVFYEFNGSHHASELCSIMTNFME